MIRSTCSPDNVQHEITGGDMKIDRAQAIRQFLFTNGPSQIAAMAEAVGTSPATLRRDLSLLESEGIVVREHGGARLAGEAETEVAFEQREAQAIAAKRAIAAHAFASIIPGSVIFLDSGTTVLQLARCIRMAPMPLTVFTNCLPAAQVLMGAPGVKLTLTGGVLRKENSSMVGPVAEAMLEGLWLSHLFLGAGAVGDDGRISSTDESEAQLNRKMIERSETTSLLVDAAKFGRRLTYEVAPLSRIGRTVTDAGIGADRLTGLHRAGYVVEVAERDIARVAEA